LWVTHYGAEQLLWEGSLQEDSFGRYQLIDLLGRGGMGEVWRARDTVIDRIVALKILPAEISRDDVFQQRFRREAHAAARLNSPHIVPIHTHGEIDGRLYVDMRLIEGHDLQSVLDAGPLPPPRAVNIVEQIARALNTAHKVGLLHRDVKPSNILLDDDDYAYLIDFGIALAIGERGLTTVGDVIGTFHYMAPERFKSQELGAPPIDARSDIYALACVLYECLTAEHPFRGDSLEQQIGNHLVTPPPRPSNINPSLPRSFDNVIAKGMAKNPSDRYETAVELARAARNAVTSPMPLPRHPVRPPTGPQHNPMPPAPPPRVESYGRPQIPAAQIPARQMPARQMPAPQMPAPQIPVSRKASAEDTLQQRVMPNVNAVGQPEPSTVRPATTTPPKPPPPWWRRKNVIVAGTAMLVVVAVVVTLMAVGNHKPKTENPGQTTLPFTDLREPLGLTVDSAGTVYIADTLNNRILQLPAKSNDPKVLPFDNLLYPSGVTTDNTGAVYVNDAGNHRVVVLRLNARKQERLEGFTDLGDPQGLSVDSAHTVYVTDRAKNKVVALASGSTKQYDLTAFTGLNAPTGLVVLKNGTIYVADSGNNRVLALAPGAGAPTTLPFVGLNGPGGVTVDSEGAVYVDSKDNRVLKLPAGSGQQIVLPFTGLDYPWGLTVDNNGTVYVAGHNNKIVALRQK
jgi:serine/threonine protein kinase, bacterial